KGDVDALGDQIGGGIGEHKIEAYQRMRCQKLNHPFHPKIVEEIGGPSNADYTARNQCACDGILACLPQSVDRLDTAIEEILPGIGQPEASCRSLDQPSVQAGL